MNEVYWFNPPAANRDRKMRYDPRNWPNWAILTFVFVVVVIAGSIH